MGQFDVHRNRGSLRTVYPYFLDVQSNQFSRTRFRVVVPLASPSELRAINPTFNVPLMVDGMLVLMDPLQTVSIGVEQLGPAVCNLADHDIAIIRALDTLIARS